MLLAFAVFAVTTGAAAPDNEGDDVPRCHGRQAEIVASQLEDDAGVLGAALLAREKLA